MVTLTSHGGNCCGARHLYGFGPIENENTETIVRELAKAPQDRMVEVILNGTQVAEYPNVLNKLRDLGFVLDGHWINGNHNSHNYRFSRADKRRPLLDGPVTLNWRGMVMTPEITGNLPPVPGQDPSIVHTPYVFPLPDNAVDNAQARYMERMRQPAGNHIGNVYRINSPQSRRHGQVLRCVSVSQPWGQTLRLVFVDLETGQRFSISRASCILQRNDDVPEENNNLGVFQVGTRIQVARPWALFPVGLVGVVTRIINPTTIEIQFDTPNSPLVRSGLAYIHIVDFETQPDIPRERHVLREPPNANPFPFPWVHERTRLANGNEVAPTIVFTTFHCVSADGTRGAGHDTIALARANLGRRNRIDRRDIMSDGSVVWVERVPAE